MLTRSKVSLCSSASSLISSHPQTSTLPAKREEILYGMSLGDTVKAETVDDDDDDGDGLQEGSIARAVPLNAKVRSSTRFIRIGIEYHVGFLHGGGDQVFPHVGT